MLRKIIALGALSVMVAACGGVEEASTKVKSLQKSDKNLSCREILLEMNEAEFYDKMAHKNRGVKLKNVLMPLGYISTYMDSEEAINDAKARVEYLDKIYEIMHCEEKEKQEGKLPIYQPHSKNEVGEKYSVLPGVRYYLDK